MFIIVHSSAKYHFGCVFVQQHVETYAKWTFLPTQLCTWSIWLCTFVKFLEDIGCCELKPVASVGTRNNFWQLQHGLRGLLGSVAK